MPKVRDIIAILRAHGFELDRQQGSHRQYEAVIDRTRRTRRIVTISQKDGEEIAKRLLGQIIRQSGLPKTLFRR